MTSISGTCLPSRDDRSSVCHDPLSSTDIWPAHSRAVGQEHNLCARPWTDYSSMAPGWGPIDVDELRSVLALYVLSAGDRMTERWLDVCRA